MSQPKEGEALSIETPLSHPFHFNSGTQLLRFFLELFFTQLHFLPLLFPFCLCYWSSWLLVCVWLWISNVGFHVHLKASYCSFYIILSLDVIYSLQNVFPNRLLMCYCVTIPTQTQEKCTIFGPIQFLRCHVAFLIAEPNHIIN